MNEQAIQAKARGRAFALPLLAWVLAVALQPAAPVAAEPLDACGLGPAPGATPAPPEEAIVLRVTGPNSVLTTTGREIRLASVTTPHRLSLPPSHAAEVIDVLHDMEGQPEAAPDVDVPAVVAGDEPAMSDPIAAARSTLSAWLLGQRIRLYPVTAPPDRYGRTRARVVRIDDSLWIEAELVKAGLARVQPQSDDFGCARQLEAIESAARTAQRGLWALPEFAALASDDITRDRFIGSYVLIEGAVVSIGTSGTRRYLNFGRNFRRDFAVVLVDKGSAGGTGRKALPNRFRDEGFLARDVIGRRIRVRGILLPQGGGVIAPGVPEEIEWVVDRP